MRIRPLVEGHGDVEAVQTLVRRIAHERLSRYEIEVLKGYRSNRSTLGGRDVRDEIEVARLSGVGAHGVLVVYDEDDDCAKELAEQFPSLPYARLAVAVREYEAWFLHCRKTLFATEESLDADRIRDAKGHVSRLLGQKYRETVDQNKLSARLPIEEACAASRSFRHFCKAVEELILGLSQSP